MKIDVSRVMIDLKDDPIKIDGAVFTLAGVAIGALLSIAESDRNISPEEKYLRYKLFKKIDNCENDICDLSAEEIKTLKEVIGKNYAPIIVGQAFDMLEGVTE